MDTEDRITLEMQLDFRLLTTTQHFSQFSVYLTDTTLRYTALHQSDCEDAVGSSAEHLTEAEEPLLSLHHQACHFKLKGCQYSSASIPLHKSMLAIPDHILILHLHGNGFQEDFLYHLPKDQGETGWPRLPQILLLKDRLTFALFPSSGTSPSGPNLSKIIKSGLAGAAHQFPWH